MFKIVQWVVIALLVAACAMMWVQTAFGWDPPWLQPLIFAINIVFIVTMYAQIRQQRQTP